MTEETRTALEAAAKAYADSGDVADPDHECSLQAAITAYHAALPPGGYGELVEEARGDLGLLDYDTLLPKLIDAIEALEAKVGYFEQDAAEQAAKVLIECKRAEAAESALAAERGKREAVEGFLRQAVEIMGSEELRAMMVCGHIHGAPYQGKVFDIEGASAALSTKGPENG